LAVLLLREKGEEKEKEKKRRHIIIIQMVLTVQKQRTTTHCATHLLPKPRTEQYFGLLGKKRGRLREGDRQILARKELDGRRRLGGG
jgi:hypothetical protein